MINIQKLYKSYRYPRTLNVNSIINKQSSLYTNNQSYQRSIYPPPTKMYFTTILASAIALTGAASAAAVPTHRYAQLRLWGEPSCATLNLGEEGIYGDQLAQCNPLDENDVVRSVSFERADAGCTCEFPTVSYSCYGNY